MANVVTEAFIQVARVILLGCVWPKLFYFHKVVESVIIVFDINSFGGGGLRLQDGNIPLCKACACTQSISGRQEANIS